MRRPPRPPPRALAPAPSRAPVRVFSRAFPVALLAASAALPGACAAPASAPDERPSAQAAEAPAGVDGRYRGTARLIRADTASCPRSGPRTLELSGGTITLSYSTPPRNRTPLTARIGGDGRIEASDGVGSMDGQARDGRLEVTIASEMCEHRWTLTKVD